jgi:DNA-binding transcriptional ArsR family regulator
MDTNSAATSLEALGSPTRLEIFRLLVRAGPIGAVVGELQAHLNIPASTLSHHIAKLVRVGLVTQERQSRSLVCRANYPHMTALLAYLQEHCCEGLQAGEARVDCRNPPRVTPPAEEYGQR